MKEYFVLFSIIILVLIPLNTFAEDSREKIIQGLQEEVDSVTDWQADFTQKAYISSIAQYDTSSGTVKIKKPGKILWEYLEPERHVLTADGKKMYFYSEEEKQVIVNDLDFNISSGVNLLFLAGEQRIEDLFHVTLNGGKSTSENIVKLRMIPKTDQMNLSYLILAVEKNSYRILSLQSFDPFENNTFVEFSNIRKNSKLPDKIFHFQIPEGTEIIHASEMMQ